MTDTRTEGGRRPNSRLPAETDKDATVWRGAGLAEVPENGRLFKEGSALHILKYLRDSIIPQWTESAEMTALATRVIDEEIAHYSALMDRRAVGHRGLR